MPLSARATGLVVAAVRGAEQLTRVPGAALRAAAAVPAALGRAADGLSDTARLGPLRFRRRAWASDGRGLIELREAADGADAGAAGRAIAAALRGVRGVNWAQVNTVTGHALVLFDQRKVTLASLVETVNDVEESRGQNDTGWSRAEPPHPGDPAAVTGAVIGLAADLAGLAAAAMTSLVVVPPVPTGARALIGIVEAQPRVRRLVEHAVGPVGADALVGIGSGVLNGLSGGVGPLAVTALSHALLLGEVRARRSAWQAQEARLREASGADPVHPPIKADRPSAYPVGPVEAFADRVAATSLLAAGAVLAVTGSASRTAYLLLIGVPPAARLGREAFAATLAWQLAGAGVLPMDPGAFRRLDRITTVLIDDSLLGLAPGDDVGPVDGSDWPAALPEILEQLAAAGLTVAAARRRTPPDQEEALPADPLSATEVRRLQADGEAVLVLATSDNDILAAADVALAVHRPGRPVGWAADLITDDPAAALTVLRAVPLARRLSRRATAVATAGTVTAGLLTTLAPWPLRGDLTLQPVYLTGLITQADGVRTALSARPAGRWR
ncbi:hypothetical protein LWC33_32240 [Pseudonocardia sp. RS11V-5]|uniref:hypothetical protein n=1 Tax=Pseudonocardia terrae TaxID=2905831 RepID=UPI001E537F59|nr:hypothetical protein [Pseudonocardia terrae]MCE3556099.1 hypothetical protein [Pseudonocardia terrae]